jgi:hypothetical protein
MRRDCRQACAQAGREESTVTTETTSLTITRAQFRFSAALMHILITVVVLNLFVEYLTPVVIDSFTISILTAVLLWLMLEVIKRLEHRVSAYFREKAGAIFRVLRILSVWAILFVSKFVIVEVAALVTAGRASLGQFLEVVAIVVSLMVAEYVLGWVYRRLGDRAAPGNGPSL